MKESKINAALNALCNFKMAYSNENGIITVGDIADLMTNIDTIEECVRKQKRIPINAERKFGLFGKSKIVRHCRKCGSDISSSDMYCHKCGQKACI